jgi:hypothetical protein
MHCRIFLIMIQIGFCFNVMSQQELYPGLRTLRLYSSHTSFPDTGRQQGHVYDSVLYDAANHYMDSSVMIVVPAGLKMSATMDLIFWFHGWRNNIDSALYRYRLASQFLASNRNAVLVLAETARNSPDSYGGKLEQPGTFHGLVEDVLNELKKEKIIPNKCGTGDILLAGHSGAYRVMARILKNGGVKISGVALFDALYAETDLFDSWIQSNIANRFFDIYTNEGGTDEESVHMMSRLKKEDMSVALFEEAAFGLSTLQSNRIVFVHSARAHNDIISDPDYFRMVIESSPFFEAMK